jgi:hypothetical protein
MLYGTNSTMEKTVRVDLGSQSSNNESHNGSTFNRYDYYTSNGARLSLYGLRQDPKGCFEAGSCVKM